MNLIFASQNSHKVKEINNILGDAFSITGLKEINFFEEIPETENTLEGNALQKARFIHKISGKDVFADDTGLEVEALNGEPGVRSARFAGESKDSNANIDKLLTLLSDIPNKNARFRTVIALIYNGKEYLFEGIVEGSIIMERRGNEGFGYDPIFVPKGYNCSFAEMTLDEKNKISHRARAFEKLRMFLRDTHER